MGGERVRNQRKSETKRAEKPDIHLRWDRGNHKARSQAQTVQEMTQAGRVDAWASSEDTHHDETTRHHATHVHTVLGRGWSRALRTARAQPERTCSMTVSSIDSFVPRAVISIPQYCLVVVAIPLQSRLPKLAGAGR